MSEKSYVLVPVDATRRMIDAAAKVDEDGYDSMHKAMLKAAPPPPESVLTPAGIEAIYREWQNTPGHANEFDLIRLAEAAVLAKFKESAE